MESSAISPTRQNIRRACPRDVRQGGRLIAVIKYKNERKFYENL